jgi:hypothetical protein
MAGNLGFTSPGRRPDGTRNNVIAHTTAVGLLLLVLSFCVLHQAARHGKKSKTRQHGAMDRSHGQEVTMFFFSNRADHHSE